MQDHLVLSCNVRMFTMHDRELRFYYYKFIIICSSCSFGSYTIVCFFLLFLRKKMSLFVTVSIIKNNVRRIQNRYAIIVNFWRVCILDVLWIKDRGNCHLSGNSLSVHERRERETCGVVKKDLWESLWHCLKPLSSGDALFSEWLHCEVFPAWGPSFSLWSTSRYLY